MNREGVKKNLKLIEEWANGAVIEYRGAAREPWRVTDNPMWDTGVQYRVKPEPRVVYVVEALPVGEDCWTVYGTRFYDKNAALSLLKRAENHPDYEDARLREYVEKLP